MIADNGKYTVNGLCDGQYTVYLVISNPAYDPDAAPTPKQSVARGVTLEYSPSLPRKPLLQVQVDSLDANTGVTSAVLTSPVTAAACTTAPSGADHDRVRRRRLERPRHAVGPRPGRRQLHRHGERRGRPHGHHLDRRRPDLPGDRNRRQCAPRDLRQDRVDLRLARRQPCHRRQGARHRHRGLRRRDGDLRHEAVRHRPRRRHQRLRVRRGRCHERRARRRSRSPPAAAPRPISAPPTSS